MNHTKMFFRSAGYILIGIPVLIMGLLHFFMTAALVKHVPSFLPVPSFWVLATGAALVAGALGILFRYQTRKAAYLIATVLTLFLLGVHIPEVIEQGSFTSEAFMNMMRELALIGGIVILASLLETATELEGKLDRVRVKELIRNQGEGKTTGSASYPELSEESIRKESLV